MLTVYICDDDSSFISSLVTLTKRYLSQESEIFTFTSAEALSDAVSKNAPDIVLLDIELKSENGISLAKKIFPSSSKTQIIYITGYVEYCTAVYETEHIYFILKPLKPLELKLALDKAIRRLNHRSPSFLFHSGSTIHRIPISEIYYIESHTRKLHVHTRSQVLETIGKLSSLPSEISDRLISCHKSFLVNPQHIKAIVSPENSFNKFFQLSTGESIPISQKKWRESQHSFLSLLSTQMIGDFDYD